MDKGRKGGYTRAVSKTAAFIITIIIATYLSVLTSWTKFCHSCVLYVNVKCWQIMQIYVQNCCDQSRYTAQSKRVALVISHWQFGIAPLGISNNARIYLSDHQSIASQCPKLNSQLPKQPLLNQLSFTSYSSPKIGGMIKRNHWGPGINNALLLFYSPTP